MLENFPFYLGIIITILLLIMLANKIKVAYPILLVVGGLLISFIPNIPQVYIKPELIFFIFLPPLLYEAAWSISWKEMWKWRRIITSFAFVVVFLSALLVAFTANYFIPGFSLALGFLLGGIVSPPDAVSAGAILKFVKVPKVISSILEGESLLNDASSLIIFRFALIAIGTGQFIWMEAATSFVWMVFGGIAIGLLVGWIFMKAHKYLPTDANSDIILSIVAPYIMYLVAEEVHCSGVLSVVSGGLLLSNNRHIFLTSASRIKGFNVWESFCFILNGIVFMLIGLDLPQITAGLDVSFASAIGYGVLITTVLVVARILSAFGAVIVTQIAKHFITVADGKHPGFRGPFILGWTGMRGVVSLAAALSIPEKLADGTAFPHRNLILFVTFVVILLTLLVQGLTLPFFIKKILGNTKEVSDGHEDVYKQIKKQLSEHALNHLKINYEKQLQNQPALQRLAMKLEVGSTNEIDEQLNNVCKNVYYDILDEQRKWLLEKNNADQQLDEHIVRRHLYSLDIEEEKLRYI